MSTNREPEKSFWEEHRKCFLFAAAALVAVAAVVVMVVAIKPASRSVDHITAVYNGDTKAGVVLDEKNAGFTVTA